jgi:hypothetical protein
VYIFFIVEMATNNLQLVFLILICATANASVSPHIRSRYSSPDNSLFRWSNDYFTPFISEIPTITPSYFQQGIVRLGFVNNSVIYCDQIYYSESRFPTNPIQVNTSEQLKAERLILKNGHKYGVNQVIFEGKIRPFSAAFDVYLPIEDVVAYDKQILTNMTFQNDLRKILDIPLKFLFYSEILVGIPQVTPSPTPYYSYIPYSYSPTYSYYVSYSPTPTPSISFYSYYSPTW